MVDALDPLCADVTELVLNESFGDAVQWIWGTDGPANFDDPAIQSPTVTDFVDGEVFTVIILDAMALTY